MRAHVYKSLRKADTYLYLRERDAFSLLPESVLAPLGKLQWVLDVDLERTVKLARADIVVVRRNLAELGFHLQVPPTALDPLVAGGVGDG